MLTQVAPKLPMRDKAVTLAYYKRLGFVESSNSGTDDYLMVQRDNVELHFFAFKALRPNDNYGQVYIRTDNIDELYASMLETNIPIHPNGPLTTKPWGQREFSLLDPDNNLLTFGQRR